MRPIVRLLAVAAALVSAEAGAGTLVTPPLPISTSMGDRGICSLVNGGRRPIGPLTITIRRYDGTIVESADFSMVPSGSTMLLLSEAAEIQTTSGLTCTADGKGVSKRTPVSLCRLPAAEYVCGATVQAP